WSTQTSTSMGSRETEVKALAVMPWTSFSESSVITVMPVAKQASALRNSGWLTPMLQNPRAVGSDRLHTLSRQPDVVPGCDWRPMFFVAFSIGRRSSDWELFRADGRRPPRFSLLFVPPGPISG